MKNKGNYLLYGLLVVVLAILLFNLFYFFEFQKGQIFDKKQNMPHLEISNMPLTSFDIQLAKRFMDKNNDSLCDVCGMDINLCIQSGQLQCNMDPESTIGVLNSAHTHAYFKVYINGKQINFANKDYYTKSSFIHLDDDQNKEVASSILHTHATGVPLWIFFESINSRFNESCLGFLDTEMFCNNQTKNIKFYVNGKPNNDFGNYSPKNLDKILISFGDVDEDIQKQLESITNFAKDH